MQRGISEAGRSQGTASVSGWQNGGSLGEQSESMGSTQ
jgi:hypothetical protein